MTASASLRPAVRSAPWLLASMVAAFGAVPARADDLQRQLLASAKATRPDGYGFRRTIAVERTGEPRHVYMELFDPRRADGQRWLLQSVDAHAPTAKEAERSAAAHRGPVSSYAQIAEWIGAPAARSEAGPGHVLYRFASLPAGVLKIGSHDASADTRAEALVNTAGAVPFVEHVRFTSVRGFRMMLVASLTSMTVDARYRAGPEGGMVPATQTSDIAGSMMGKSGSIRTATTFSDFVRVR